MVKFKPKDPDTIVLIATFRCNASCEMCCHGCRPDFGRTMTMEQMKRYIDICLGEYSHSIRTLSLTGGECFLLGDDLDEIIKYGAGKGLMTVVLSNGFWGYNYKGALNRIMQLKEAGLTSIGFSAGDDHNHQIPFRSVRNAVVASVRAGYKVEFRTERNFRDHKVRNAIEKDNVLVKLISQGKILYYINNWENFNNESVHHSLRATRNNYSYEKSSPCQHISHEIEITPHGDVLACTGIGNLRIPQMRLGNIENEPIRTIYERQFEDALKMWIRSKGPLEILKYVYKNSKITTKFRTTRCEYCKEIFLNPKIIPFLKEHSKDWIKEILHY